MKRFYHNENLVPEVNTSKATFWCQRDIKADIFGIIHRFIWTLDSYIDVHK